MLLLIAHRFLLLAILLLLQLLTNALLLEVLLPLTQFIRISFLTLLLKIRMRLHLRLFNAVHNQTVTRHTNLLMHVLRIEKADRTRVHVLSLAEVAPVRVHLNVTILYEVHNVHLRHLATTNRVVLRITRRVTHALSPAGTRLRGSPREYRQSFPPTCYAFQQYVIYILPH